MDNLDTLQISILKQVKISVVYFRVVKPQAVTFRPSSFTRLRTRLFGLLLMMLPRRSSFLSSFALLTSLPNVSVWI